MGILPRVLLDVLGIPSIVMEKSDHCYHTRAVKNFCKHDICDIPYPFYDKQFDIAYSTAVLEHIGYEDIDDVIREMVRISKRGYHLLGYKGDKNDGGLDEETFFSDGTHIIYEDLYWWKSKFSSIAPNYDVKLISDQNDGKFGVPFIKNEFVRLNLGCGLNIFGSGWINIDCQDLTPAISEPYVFKNHDITTRLPYEDNSCDMTFLGNTLENIPPEHGCALVSEVYRVLKPGGVVRMAIIDAEYLMKKYVKGNLDFLKHIYGGIETTPCDIIKLSNAIFSQSGTVYDKCLAREVLKGGGFNKIYETNPFDSRNALMAKTTTVSYPTISFVMEAIK